MKFAGIYGKEIRVIGKNRERQFEAGLAMRILLRVHNVYRPILMDRFSRR